MKLKNKKTGEIGWLYCDHISIPKKMTVFAEDKDLSVNHWDYKTLAELNEEWKDYEEPKEYWYIDWNGEAGRSDIHDERTEQMKLIGNYFESKEEAEKAVEKLKALERLKDKGFRFDGYTDDSGDLFSCQVIRCRFDDFGKESRKDLDLLFSGEDD